MFWLVGHLLLLCKIKILVERRCLWFLHSWSRIEAWKQEIIKVWVILLTVGSVLAAFTPTVFPIYFRWEAPRVVQPWWFATAFTSRYSNTWRWTQPNSLLAASTSHYGSQSQETRTSRHHTRAPHPAARSPHNPRSASFSVNVVFIFSLLSLLFYLFIFYITTVFHTPQTHSHSHHTGWLLGVLQYFSTNIKSKPLAKQHFFYSILEPTMIYYV